MLDSDLALQKRFAELSDRAETRQMLVYSDFLNIHEQSALQSMKRGAPYVLFGGYPTVKSNIGNRSARTWVTHYNLEMKRFNLIPETESNSAILKFLKQAKNESPRGFGRNSRYSPQKVSLKYKR